MPSGWLFEQLHPNGEPRRSKRDRFISFLEVVAATALIVAQLQWGLRYTFWTLTLIATVSLRFRDGSWAALGFTSPPSWPRTFVIAGIGACALVFGSVYVVYPLGELLGLGFSGETNKRAEMDYISRAFVLSWTVLAFVQGPVYFRYILERGADWLGNTRIAYGVSAVYVSVLFAVSHLRLGTIALIPWAGLTFAAAYLLGGRNLWTVILMRGFAESFGLVRLFFEILMR